jgi:hypothetical protein
VEELAEDILDRLPSLYSELLTKDNPKLSAAVVVLSHLNSSCLLQFFRADETLDSPFRQKWSRMIGATYPAPSRTLLLS